MKKLRILIPVGLFLVAGLIFVACQKDAPIRGEKKVMATYDENVDCATACLQDGPFYQEQTSWTNQWAELSGFPNYYKNNKYFKTTTWNDEDYFYVKVDVFGYQYDIEKINKENNLTGPTYNNYPFSTVIITVNGVVHTYAMDDATTTIVETATSYTQAFPLTAGWDKCAEMVYSVRIEGNGSPVWLGTETAQAAYTYRLIAPCGCEASLVTNLDCGATNTLTVTFIPEEDGYYAVQGGLNANAEIQTKGANGLTENTTHPSTINSNASVTRWEGNLTACVPVTVTITFTGNCSIGTWSFQKL